MAKQSMLIVLHGLERMEENKMEIIFHQAFIAFYQNWFYVMIAVGAIMTLLTIIFVVKEIKNNHVD